MLSLIVATVNRTAELERLLASLDAQTWRDFEVIIVDQNPDDRLVSLLQRHPALAVVHLRSARGLSKARNVGLRAAKGDIIAVPDDDCWYSSDLLSTVNAWFGSHPTNDVLLAITRSAENRPMVPKFAPGSGPCNRKNLWRCVVSNGLFWRRKVLDAVGFFDEDLGVGAPTPYQSSEESDYVLRALGHGFQAWYEPGISVYHSEYQSVERLRRVSHGYALGVGHVARAHGYSWFFLAGLLVRSLGGAAIHLCKGEVDWAQVYWLRAQGQCEGYLVGPKTMPRSNMQVK